MSDELESRIREILQSTPVDQLGTITAKDVRARLIADGSVDEAWIKENKKSVNALIGSVYEEACAPLVRGAEDNSPKDEEGESYTNGEVAHSEREGTATTSQYADEDEGVGYEDYGGSVGGDASTSTPPPRTKSKSHKKSAAKSKRKLTDEEYARRLSSEINGRPRSSRLGKSSQVPSKSNRKSVSRTSKRNKKSAERVDDSDGGSVEDEDDAGYDSDPRPTKKRKKSRKTSENGGAKGGFKKEYVLSVPLSALLEVDRLSRPQVVKQLWEYIKGNNLQNPSNRKEILCDDLLRPIFNADKIDMFKMNKVLGQHLHEAE